MLSLRAFLGMDTSGYELGIKRAKSLASKFAAETRGDISNRLAGFLTLAAAEQAISKTIEYAGHVRDLSDRLEISTDALQQWGYAATQAGSSAEKVAVFFEKLAEAREKALGGGPDSVKPLASFQKLGISPSDLKNSRLEDIGLKIGNTVKEGDAQAFISSLRDVGGRGATSLVAAFKSGLEEAFAGAPLIKVEQIIELDAIGDEIDTAGKKMMATFAPVISFVTKGLLYAIDQFQAKWGAAMTFVSSLVSGKGIHESIFAARKTFDEISLEFMDREKRIQEQVEAAKNKGKSADPIETPPEKEKTEISTPERATKEASQRQVNSLQQIGAKVAFNPAQDQNTRAIQRLTHTVDRLEGTLKAKTMAGQGWDHSGGSIYA